MIGLSSWLLTGIAMATAASFWLYMHTGQRDSMPYAAAQQADLTIRQPSWTLFDRHGDSVETDEAVVLPAGSWHFNATGMRANLGRQRLELLAQARGIHE